jgi:hypothetical protein
VTKTKVAMAKDQACQLFNYLHVFRCLVRVKWAKLDLTSTSALQLGQMTALLIVFVGTVFLCLFEEFLEGSGVLSI